MSVVQTGFTATNKDDEHTISYVRSSGEQVDLVLTSESFSLCVSQVENEAYTETELVFSIEEVQVLRNLLL